MIHLEPLDGELALASHWVVMDSFLEFLGTFPLGMLTFVAIAAVFLFSVLTLFFWIVSKITGKTFAEVVHMFGGGKGPSITN